MLITFEGPDASGKTTIIKEIAKLLKKNKINHLITREPGGYKIKFSEKIRKILKTEKNLDPITEFLLFSAARREHITKLIEPNKEKVILCDRFIDSSKIYQGKIFKLNEEKINQITEWVITKEFIPNLTFVLIIDEKSLKERIKKRSKFDKFDNQSIKNLKFVNDEYKKLATKNKRIKIIDNSNEKTINETVNEIWKIISNFLKKEKKLR